MRYSKFYNVYKDACPHVGGQSKFDLNDCPGYDSREQAASYARGRKRLGVIELKFGDSPFPRPRFHVDA